MAEKSVLVISDDKYISRLFEIELEEAGLGVITITNDNTQIGKLIDGIKVSYGASIELVILDSDSFLSKPSNNIQSVLEELDSMKIKCILFGFESREKYDVIFEKNFLCVKDYFQRPFSDQSFVAKVCALSCSDTLNKKRFGIRSNYSAADNIQIDIKNSVAYFKDKPLCLTKTEFALLSYLMEKRGYPVSRIDLFNKIWGCEYDGQTNVVDVYIRYIRKKIEAKYNVKLIQTVRGTGYMIKL